VDEALGEVATVVEEEPREPPHAPSSSPQVASTTAHSVMRPALAQVDREEVPIVGREVAKR
jgi:hypothetical protein